MSIQPGLIEINAAQWLNDTDIENCELLKRACYVESVDEQLLNHDNITLYTGYDDQGVARELVSDYINNDQLDFINNYFDFDKFGTDYVNEDNSYFYDDIIDGYAYIPDFFTPPTDNYIIIGCLKSNQDNTVFCLKKPSFECGHYWSYNNLMSGGCNSSLKKEYFSKHIDDVFDHTWIEPKVWTTYSNKMRDLGDPLNNDMSFEVLGSKLNEAWDYLMSEYKKYKLVLNNGEVE